MTKDFNQIPKVLKAMIYMDVIREMCSRLHCEGQQLISTTGNIYTLYIPAGIPAKKIGFLGLGGTREKSCGSGSRLEVVVEQLQRYPSRLCLAAKIQRYLY
ncbi:unnamed protein product [Orchesella dallaii]|uniref:Cytosol aminopeptidase n=1 Tax=Orchesella dallaii TaxID=48710 RepID=A0ABP1QF95_9HEXA